MSDRVADLNADLGESFGAWQFGDDTALMEFITSANIACGFHAGDPLTLRRTCALAAARGVSIGAQVSYRDLAGFGRREMHVASDELTAELLYQIAALDGLARVEGSRVRYVKPHGALYNRVVRDPVQAAALIEAIVSYDPTLPLLALPGGVAAQLAADAGLTVIGEAFADRGYTDEGTLVPRGQPGALRTDPAEVAARAVAMITRQEVISVTGRQVTIQARSICVHGDTAGAAALAKAVRQALTDAGVRLAPFTAAEAGGPAPASTAGTSGPVPASTPAGTSGAAPASSPAEASGAAPASSPAEANGAAPGDTAAQAGGAAPGSTAAGAS